MLQTFAHNYVSAFSLGCLKHIDIITQPFLWLLSLIHIFAVQNLVGFLYVNQFAFDLEIVKWNYLFILAIICIHNIVFTAFTWINMKIKKKYDSTQKAVTKINEDDAKHLERIIKNEDIYFLFTFAPYIWIIFSWFLLLHTFIFIPEHFYIYLSSAYFTFLTTINVPYSNIIFNFLLMIFNYITLLFMNYIMLDSINIE